MRIFNRNSESGLVGKKKDCEGLLVVLEVEVCVGQEEGACEIWCSDGNQGLTKVTQKRQSESVYRAELSLRH